MWAEGHFIACHQASLHLGLDGRTVETRGAGCYTHTQKKTCEKLRKLKLVCTMLEEQSGGW